MKRIRVLRGGLRSLTSGGPAARIAAEHAPALARWTREAHGHDAIIARSSAWCERLHEALLPGERRLVLVAGEVGTPRAAVARLLHRAAGLPGKFVRVRCSSAPGFASELFGDATRGRPGRVNEAEGGTLFLEAIDRLSLELQARLLPLAWRQTSRHGAGKERPVNVRIVAASERELWPLVEGGCWREDLYRRLAAHRIELTPLRDHPDEIAPLAQRLLELMVRRRGGPARQLAPSTLAALAAYAWPGNVRELKRVIEALVAGSDARVLELPRGWLAPRAEREQSDELAEHDRQQIADALRQSSGALLGPNGAAARLGMQPSTLRFRMRRLGLWPPGSERR